MKAFPNQSYEDHYGNLVLAESGMDLRDYFAAKAMQGNLSCQSEYCGEYMLENFGLLAQRSYEIADAMMKAREVK